MHTGRFSKLIPWLFAGPALIAMALFYVYPTIVTVILSFTRGTITTPAKEFVGLDNYRILLTEDRFFLSFEDGFIGDDSYQVVVFHRNNLPNMAT